MKMLAECAIAEKPVADVGTDHGFVPIHLIASEKCPFAVMTDINEGPLEKAQKNLNRVGILPQYYDLRLGNGLKPVKKSEVSTIIIAGMGAETIIEILSDDLDKTKSYERFVLQPRKRPFLLRQWLFENSFQITEERLVKEDGKLCEIIVAMPCTDVKSHDDYYLPEKLYEDALFDEYLKEYIRKVKIVIENMQNSKATTEIIESWKDRLIKAERLQNEKQTN